jgi:acyl-CoA synthetase (AMP-forming)/AMP-acid ligase II
MSSTPPPRNRFSDRIPFGRSNVAVLTSEEGSIFVDKLRCLRPRAFAGASSRVAISIGSTSSLLRMLAAFDGRVSAILLLSSSLAPEWVTALCKESGCSILVSDRAEIQNAIPPEAAIDIGSVVESEELSTTWIMTTSGTTGRPKMLEHSFDSLCRSVQPIREYSTPAVWGLTYEPTRFAGLQVLLQAIIGGGRLIAPDFRMELGRKLTFLADNGCTHLSASPTLWRQILMHPKSTNLALSQVTLGGEIADQGVLDALRRAFPRARITHVYALTEVGVAFSVNDGRAGFPARYLDMPPKGVVLRIAEGRLWLRAPGVVADYLGSERLRRDSEGFVDTQDRVDRRGDRILFLGRDIGTVNIGGVKIHPEMVESAILCLPGVALVRVSSIRSALSGALLVATIVPAVGIENTEKLKRDVIKYCRSNLPREGVPALITIADNLEVNAAGKLSRS